MTEVISQEASTDAGTLRLGEVLLFLALGIVFGVILTKSEVISWFRIQEMFRFQSFHMYGIIGSAIVVSAVSLALFTRFELKAVSGKPISLADKPYERGINQWAGGIIFGLGWALTGACPGPLYALIGNGVTVIVVPLLAAMAGAWVYGASKHALPH